MRLLLIRKWESRQKSGYEILRRNLILPLTSPTILPHCSLPFWNYFIPFFSSHLFSPIRFLGLNSNVKTQPVYWYTKRLKETHSRSMLCFIFHKTAIFGHVSCSLYLRGSTFVCILFLPVFFVNKFFFLHHALFFLVFLFIHSWFFIYFQNSLFIFSLDFFGILIWILFMHDYPAITPINFCLFFTTHSFYSLVIQYTLINFHLFFSFFLFLLVIY